MSENNQNGPCEFCGSPDAVTEHKLSGPVRICIKCFDEQTLQALTTDGLRSLCDLRSNSLDYWRNTARKFLPMAANKIDALADNVSKLEAEAYKQTERANIAEMELNWLWRQVQEAHDLAESNPEATQKKLRYVMAQTTEEEGETDAV